MSGHADDALADVMATIRLWQSMGITAPEAWRALGMRWSWGVEWWEVRLVMLRLALGGTVAGPKFKHGPLPAVRRAA
jgi:hypothetical protein